MPDEPGHPKLYDIMPSGQFRAAMRAALPEEASFAWRLAGTLDVTGSGLVVMDPAFFRPGAAVEEGLLLDWPAEHADVWLRAIVGANGEVLRIAAVLISVTEPELGAVVRITKDQVGSTAVDSAHLMVADAGRLDACWEVGGPLNESSLGRDECDSKPRRVKEKAAALLTDHGFPLVRNERRRYLGYRFGRPLDNDDLARANRLLESAGLPERVNVIMPHTLALIEAGLVGAATVRVGDPASPYLVAFATGWGDGIYWWDRLKDGGKVLGYLCDFMAEDSAA
jgi:hypothetical protein